MLFPWKPLHPSFFYIQGKMPFLEISAQVAFSCKEGCEGDIFLMVHVTFLPNWDSVGEEEDDKGHWEGRYPSICDHPSVRMLNKYLLED